MWLAPWSAEAALPRAVAAQSGWIRWCGSAQLSCLRWMVTCSLCGQWVGGTSPTNPAGSMNRKRSLRFAGLHPRTLRAYRQALDRCLKFVKKRTRLAEFIDLSYQEGEPLSYAGHLLSAMKRFHPELRLELPRSSQYFRNWQRCYTPREGCSSLMGPGAGTYGAGLLSPGALVRHRHCTGLQLPATHYGDAESYPPTCGGAPQGQWAQHHFSWE